MAYYSQFKANWNNYGRIPARQANKGWILRYNKEGWVVWSVKEKEVQGKLVSDY